MPKGIPKVKADGHSAKADQVEAEAMGSSLGTGMAVSHAPEPEMVDNKIPGAVYEKSVDSEYKIEVIKDYHGNVDVFYLPKKDPRYEYSFLRADDKNLSMKTGNMLFQGGGWQLCDKPHLLRIGIEDRFISPDGLHRRGDLVLAFIPKHLFAEKRADKAKKALALESAVDSRIAGGSSEGGGIHESMKGLQTQEQLGLK